jgi:hypothetical protein
MSDYVCSCGDRFGYYTNWNRHVDRAIARRESPTDHLLIEQPDGEPAS